ncbi:uncharacterized protein THITE_2116160 [Thermothielavioides terrestris NRRL 8126]|uniref:Uncharacterized protein n=1 Tax=Thermothielavioides terrestris (strain ATCC 38088 / NRRL 8126) TaxID=578455 RepID=G2R090_THETT|nr:uncharacterized protein THITE_2116160 [Thermothielavioides terrestris NRRL 8126]AEO67258.1 hypothetical protein THITE_2116160 [Thermothielavioides terrestris NRRL 8126]
MLWQRTLVSSLLAIGAQAGIGDLVMEGLTRNGRTVERSLEESAMASLETRAYLETRQTMNSGTPLKSDGSIDLNAWNTQVNAACQDSLRSLHTASNPSGTCVCYNLPLLNNETGAFEADLRLFQLSPPTGDFQGIPQDQIQVELSYQGASVSEVKNASAASAVRLRARQDNGNGTDLPLLQSYMFVGQVDKDKMTGQVSMAQWQALVMPIVTLKATNGNGQTVSTNVSSNEAAFVTGVFSKDVVMSNLLLAQLAVNDQLAGLKNGTVAFVLPGIQLMIFPIGLIITSVWLLLGLVAYGFGTYERYQFREAHRRRVAVAAKAAVARF